MRGPNQQSFFAVVDSIDHKRVSDKYNRDKHNYRFLFTFSFVSILLQLLPVSRELHNVFYSANVFSLMGYTIIMLAYPSRLYNHYGETIRNIVEQVGLSEIVDLNIYWVNLLGLVIHVIPVWIFRNAYSLGNLTILMFVYFVIAGPYLEIIYNLAFHEIAVVFLLTSVMFAGLMMRVQGH
jgi:hypothetical protein